MEGKYISVPIQFPIHPHALSYINRDVTRRYHHSPMPSRGVQVIVDILMNHMASPCRNARKPLQPGASATIPSRVETIWGDHPWHAGHIYLLATPINTYKTKKQQPTYI